MSYCVFCAERDENDMHRLYHDNHYGFPIEDDNELFGRLILEINQAGLSWSTILLKQDSFRAAYDEFNVLKIANYDQSKIEQLLSNSGIIRNRLKIQVAVYNARQIVAIQQEFLHVWTLSPFIAAECFVCWVILVDLFECFVEMRAEGETDLVRIF